MFADNTLTSIFLITLFITRSPSSALAITAITTYSIENGQMLAGILNNLILGEIERLYNLSTIEFTKAFGKVLGYLTTELVSWILPVGALIKYASKIAGFIGKGVQSITILEGLTRAINGIFVQGMRIATNLIRYIDNGIQIGSRLVKFVILSGGRIGLLRDGMFDLIKTMSKAEFDQLIEMVSDPKLKEGWKTFMYGVGGACKVVGYTAVVLLSSNLSNNAELLQKQNNINFEQNLDINTLISTYSIKTYALDAGGCQRVLSQLAQDWIEIDFTKKDSVIGYTSLRTPTESVPTKTIEKLNLLESGKNVDVKAESLAEAKYLFLKSKSKYAYGKNEIQPEVIIHPPHAVDGNSSELHKKYYHINTDKGTILFDF